jgi:3-dehydroquinate dehydratase I
LICVSLREPDLAAFLRALDGLKAEMAEIRLDGARLRIAEVERLFSRPIPLVAAFRPTEGVSEKARSAALAAAVRAGARWLDLELESVPGLGASLIPQARARGCRLIISHHDEGRTPDRSRLEDLVEACFAAGGDIAKIACRVRTRADCARILALYEDRRPLIALGMGPLGRITRAAAPLLGAPFTYASADGGNPTADGQLEWTALSDLLAILDGR